MFGLDPTCARGQLGPVLGGRGWRLPAGPTLLRVYHSALPALKLKDVIWKSVDSRRPPLSSGNLAPLPVWHPLLKGAASHTLKQLTLPQDWGAFGQTTFLNSPCWRDSHFPRVSLLKKETLFLSNGIQQFKKKKSIELCNFLWSPGKTDLGFDSFKM